MADSSFLSAIQPQSGMGLSVSRKSVETLGDLLANSTGLSTPGTIGNVLQTQAAGNGFDATAPNTVLAAQLNPAINLSPSNSLQVTDFVNTSADAFPTQASADTTAPAASTDTTSTASSGQDASSAQTDPSQGAAAQTGIYNAIANASASTIRGSTVNTVA